MRKPGEPVFPPDPETTMELVFPPFRIEVSVVGPQGPYGRRARRELAIQVALHLKPLYQRLSYEHIRHRDGSYFLGERGERGERSISPYQACRLDHPVGQLGYQIRMARLNARLTQKALAALLGLNSRHLSQLEKGRYRPCLETRRKIEQILGIQLLEPETSLERETSLAHGKVTAPY